MSDYQWQDGDLQQIHYEITETNRLLGLLVDALVPKPEFSIGDLVLPAYEATEYPPKKVIAVRPCATWKFTYTLEGGGEYSQHNLRAAH